MRGPIDFIIVGFEGQKFDGSILSALADSIDKGIIGLIGLTVVSKDDEGEVTVVDLNAVDDETMTEFIAQYKPEEASIDDEDVAETAELLENNTAAGLLVIEQLWAIPLKEALIKANGVLVAEGRIHPDAASELEG